MKLTDWMANNPERTTDPINTQNLKTAISSAKLRDGCRLRLDKCKDQDGNGLVEVPLFPYIGKPEQTLCSYTYSGDKMDAVTINDFSGSPVDIPILGGRNSLVKLFNAAGILFIGEVNNHDLFDEINFDQLAVFYSYGLALNEHVNNGTLVPRKAKTKKAKAKQNIVTTVSGISLNTVAAKKKAKSKAKAKADLNSLTKAELTALLAKFTS